MVRTIATAIALLWAAPVTTETVEVFGGGSVDLATFACTETARSTIIQSVCYDGAASDLLVSIRGSYRNYCHVPPATFDAFITAPSMGHFYRRNIAASDIDGPFNCFSARSPKD